jgi:hypothetical protein
VYDGEQTRDEKTALNQLNQGFEPELNDGVEAFEAQYLKKTAMKEMMEEFEVENLKKTGRRMVLKDLKLMETR